MNKNRIAYIYSKNLITQCNRIPSISNRASIVQDLIQTYNLLNSENLSVYSSLEATEDELKLFHSSNFIEFCKKTNNETDLDKFDDEAAEFGLSYDCPLLPQHYDLIKTLAGGSITGAKLLTAKKCQIAINWNGGWHHAQRDSAAGFCYVNDVVLAIQVMTKSFRKILYLDLDVHHGDGVENAFELSKNILTLSFHKLLPGFYPGTGRLDDIGFGNGKYHAINVPLKHGFTSKTYKTLFQSVFPLVYQRFQPDALVVQCGADCIKGDRIGESQLNIETIGDCIRRVLSYKMPTLFLGGGGYNSANTARLWTHLTEIICDKRLDNDIPDSSEYFMSYGPSYELLIDEGVYEKDQNSDSYIHEIISKINEYCQFL